MNDELDIIELGTASEETQSMGTGAADSELGPGHQPGT
jgi:hypothetical protein